MAVIVCEWSITADRPNNLSNHALILQQESLATSLIPRTLSRKEPQVDPRRLRVDKPSPEASIKYEQQLANHQVILT